VQGDLFRENSLLVKSLPNTLTDKQLAQYNATPRTTILRQMLAEPVPFFSSIDEAIRQVRLLNKE